jgi:hypothetical protein
VSGPRDVAQDVDLAEVLADPAHQVGPLVPFRDVEPVAPARAAELLHHGRDTGFVDVSARDVRALGREDRRGRPAETGRGARHDRHLAVE